MRMLRAAMLAALLSPAAAPAASAQDIGEGQILFNQRCAFCHTLTRQDAKPVSRQIQRPEELGPQAPGTHDRPLPGTGPGSIAATTRGPHLAGLLGRRPGSVEGYAYANDYARFGDEWTRDTLDAWIDEHDGGRTRPEARAHIIAYLATLRSQ